MKTTDFKLWDVFEDGITNKLNVVIKIDDTRVHVISDKRSIYSLKRHNDEVCYKVLTISPEVVFIKYKTGNLTNYERKVFNKVMKDYNHKNLKLLLL